MKKLLSIITILTLLLSHAVHAKVDKDVNVAKVQAMLAELCYKPGIVDGAWGKKTETAVKAFFAKHYRKYDGNLDVNDANFILSACASAKAFGSASVKKCLVVYSDRIGDDLKNVKIKQITQNVANKKKKPKKLKSFTSKSSTKNLKLCRDGDAPNVYSTDGSIFTYKCIANKPTGINTYNGGNPSESAILNDKTLRYFLHRYLYLMPDWNNKFHTVKGSNRPFNFQFELREDKYVNQQMQTTPLLSYLLYEDGKIVVDEITPKNRFGDMFANSSFYHSRSMGKSIAASYLTGHAICDGIIESVDSRLDDWPLIEDTLYHNQKLIDLLNMASGDSAYVKFNKLLSSGRNTNDESIQSIMKNELKGSKKSYGRYSYSEPNPDSVLSYLLFKYGDAKFKKLLDDVFLKKVRIRDGFIIGKHQNAKKHEKSLFATVYATRYDYLRIAKAMLDDWQNDTCVGKYLKTIHERRIPKHGAQGTKGRIGLPRGYGGFFHTNYPGMGNRPVMSMDGWGGQTITIDFEKGRIIATLSIHDTTKYPQQSSFDWKNIVYRRIYNDKSASILPAKEKQPAEPVINSQQLILDNEARQESERKAKEYWINYYTKVFSGDWGASADGSTMFIEDFENTDKRKVRVKVINDDVNGKNKWYIKQDNDGNSVYCNKSNSGWSNFNFGSEDWSDYSISYKMKFSADKFGRLETYIRKKHHVQYKALINSSGRFVEWTKIQLIASGKNIKFLVDDKVFANSKNNRIKKGAGMIAVSPFLEVCVDDIVVKKVSSENK